MIAKMIANYYRKTKLLSEHTIECMEYAMLALENEISKLLMFALVFMMLGLLKQFLLSYTVFVSVRIFAGGIHCKTYWRCAVVSMVMFIVCVFGANLCSDFGKLLFVISLLSIVCPLVLSPMTPSFRIIKTDNHKRLLKILAILLSLGWIILAGIIAKHKVLSHTIMTTVSVANYQLVIPAMLHLKKRR